MASHGVPRVAGSGSRDTAKEQKKIQEYQSLVELVNAKISEREYTIEVLALTTKLLSKNPEYYTIWNHRRLILQHQFTEEPSTSETTEDNQLPPKQQRILDLISDDLRLLVGLLIEFPKCYWIWNYRRWLLEEAEQRLPTAVAVSFWQKELGLVSKMLARDERNFHGWSYRRTVVASLERLSEKSGARVSMVEDEFAYTTKMIYSGLKNFSAWHNRSKLIPRLLDERKADNVARRKMLDEELELIQTALTDPFNQSAWDYHAFLMGTISPNSSVETVIVRDFTNHDRVIYFEREMDRIKEMLQVDEDCKFIYLALLQYAATYLDIEGGNKYVTTREMRDWLAKLRELDTLRRGRWDDLESKLHL
ncbi:geranylgeranyl transferase type 2 subunit alpha [Rhizodiscina lignyota]|uniref:Geranylgeranyl transferase type-2 subunit alpha n=1 Tax=Rhizodiscina lignyota TaxID=1504668 RepID=A0A9P4I659_9PEZI|nr:geranylgeranyl transferase type 2 subunit alpha [Rhizodiscina lignyota]